MVARGIIAKTIHHLHRQAGFLSSLAGQSAAGTGRRCNSKDRTGQDPSMELVLLAFFCEGSHPHGPRLAL